MSNARCVEGTYHRAVMRFSGSSAAPGGVPIVDVTGFAAAEPAERAALAARIREVSTELGFLYLAGTGITQPAIDQLFAQSAAFFALPDAEKHAFAVPHRLDARMSAGYVPQGREHEDDATPSDIKEALDLFLASGYNADAFPPAIDAALPPASATPLRAFAAYHAQCTQVANDLLRAFAIGFGLEADYFVPLHGGNNMLRLLHYPPVPADAPANAVRVGAHTDFGTLTILVQDPSGGLEVLAADGRWLYAPSIPGTVLVNIGDLMQQWTNGEFRSTQHRVAVPPDARATRSRFSVAFFCEPNNETTIAPLPTARAGERPHFAPVRAGDHLRARLSKTLIPKA
jgi:isopenicillin N synthase-like dioxygenase